MTTILLAIVIALLIINIFIGVKKSTNNSQSELKDIQSSISNFESSSDRSEKSIKDEFHRNRTENSVLSKSNREELTTSLNQFGEQFSKNVGDLNNLLTQKIEGQNKQQFEFNKQNVENSKENRTELAKSLKSFESHFSENIKDIEQTIEKNLKSIREDNSKQLNEMRATVDEKLQTTLEKRLGESFKQVSDRLEQVHKGLGEMQSIAAGVGDLKKVLTNVKTRGVLGEYQLENILEQVLTPDQYAKNVATKKGSQANVEFALKLPGKTSDKEVWLPIDSKFPIEDYDRLIDAFETGDKAVIETAQKTLLKKIESFAKDISNKYIDPPHTTDFAIMFLPIESLYAEVLRHPGLFEILQNKYKITITGPTTLSALLNSLQMGFRTLAVQKRSSEVWDVLKAVKQEFGTFTNVLAKVSKQLNTASGTLDTLRTTRTNIMTKKLKDVEILTVIDSNKVLELSEGDDFEEE